MAFTVDDFSDLLHLLDQHPEWEAELRRHILTQELLELPAITRQLAEAQARTETRLEELAQAQARTEARLQELAQAQARTEARVEELAQAQTRTEARLESLTARVDTLAEQLSQLTARVDALTVQVGRLDDRVGDLSGKMLEIQYRARAGAYFSSIARRLRVLDPARLADRLEDAVEAGQLSTTERAAIVQADLVLSGVRREDQMPIYLVVEISAGIGAHDVERAAERARLLTKLGQPTLPVVAGDRIPPEIEAQARAAGVWQVLDGHTVAPPGVSTD